MSRSVRQFVSSALVVFGLLAVAALVIKVSGGSGLGEPRQYDEPIQTVDVCPGAACSAGRWQGGLSEWTSHGAARRAAVPAQSCARWPEPGRAQVRPWPQTVPPETGLTQAQWDREDGWTVTRAEGSAVHWLRECAYPLMLHEQGHLDWPDTSVGCSPMRKPTPGVCWLDVEKAYRGAK